MEEFKKNSANVQTFHKHGKVVQTWKMFTNVQNIYKRRKVIFNFKAVPF